MEQCQRGACDQQQVNLRFAAQTAAKQMADGNQRRCELEIARYSR